MSYNQSGITGNLVSVHLSDLMLSFEKNKQTGTLHIGPQDGGTKIYIRNGAVFGCSSPLVDAMPFILHTALRRGLVTAQNITDILKIVSATGQSLRQSISRSRLINDADVDMVAAFCVEERIFPLFQMTEGYFAFNESESIAGLPPEEIVELKDSTLRISQIIMEAARRNDEWERVRAVVDSTALYIVDTKNNDIALRNFEASNPEAGVVARYLDGKNTLYAVASKTGVGLLEIHVFVSELVQAGLVRIQAPSDVVADALELQQQGLLLQACDLLETVRIHTQIEEVLRPLAVIYLELTRNAEAVAIYTELAQSNHDRGLLTEALSDVDAAIAVAPEDAELHYLRARICTDLGDNEGAASGYRFVAQTMRLTQPEQSAQTPPSASTSSVKRPSDQYLKSESSRISAPSQDQHNPHPSVQSSSTANRTSGQYEMGNLPKSKSDPLIPARPPSGDEIVRPPHEYEEIAALTAEHITLMYKTTSIPAPLVKSVAIQLQKILTDDQSSRVAYQAVAEAKNILDFQRYIDTQLQGEVKGRIIMAVINETLIDECKNFAQRKLRATRTDEVHSAVNVSKVQHAPSTSAATSISEKDTEVVKTALVHCMGPIGSVLMKRHLAKAKNVQSLIASLESELPDEQTRATFRATMSKNKLI